jgi:hypothetical protein
MLKTLGSTPYSTQARRRNLVVETIIVDKYPPSEYSNP